MDIATRLAIRAVISGLHYSKKIGEEDCKAIVQALDEAGTLAKAKHPGESAAQIDALAADVARDCFGPDHPIALAALRKSQTE